jgi:hypothetical protein
MCFDWPGFEPVVFGLGYYAKVMIAVAIFKRSLQPVLRLKEFMGVPFIG